MSEIGGITVTKPACDLFVGHFCLAQVLDGKPHAHLGKKITIRGTFRRKPAPQRAWVNLQFLRVRPESL